jgi:hypothetical protein
MPRWLKLPILTLLLMSSCGIWACSNSKAYVIPPKPKTQLTLEQAHRTPVDVKETLRDREMEWQAVYQALVEQLR